MGERSDHARLLRELRQLLATAADEGRTIEYDLDSLYDRVHARSLAALTLALSELIAAGRTTVVFRVTSPTGGALGDFPSPAEVPSRLEDRFDDWREIEVTPERVVPVYKFSCAR